MKKFSAFNVLSFVMLWSLAAVSWAEPPSQAESKAAQQSNRQEASSHYITDTLDIPVRSGAGRNYRIINLLPSGTPVKVLDVNEKGWAHIQYEWKGQTRKAWAPSSLLTNEAPAAVQLDRMRKRLEAQTVRLQQLEGEMKNLRREYEQTKARLSEAQKKALILGRENEHLRRLVGSDLDLDRENQRLKKEVKRLQEEKQILDDQVNNSEDAIKRRWFLTGAAVLFGGALLGFFLRLPSGRQRRWNRL